MALVMIVVEVISALLAPAAEIVAPVFVLFGEVLFWVALLVVEFFVALICWRKPKIPSKPRFRGVRGKVRSFSNGWRKKRESRKPRDKSS